MTKCKTHKCKASCCYNVPLPSGYLARFADKIVTKPVEICSAPYNPLFPPSIIPITSVKLLDNKCPFLRADFRCNIYESRPEICRRFGDGSHPNLSCRYLS